MIPAHEWYVYIVCCHDGTLYTGIAKNLTKRIAEHNSVKGGAKYTRSRKPVRLIYAEPAESRSEAAQREYQIKRMSLAIKPHWFAVWMITSLGLDLNHEIPIAHIKGVVQTGKWFGYGIVNVDFRTEANEGRTILLYLKKHNEFVEAINTLLAA